MQVNNENTSVKQDDFRVGDVVWCTLYGKGEVTTIMDEVYKHTYPVICKFPSGSNSYTLDGKIDTAGHRTLFFSEPKIEASVTHPFVPTLIGKRCVILPAEGLPSRIITVLDETKDCIFVNTQGQYWPKKAIKEIYELGENLLEDNNA